MYNELRSKSTTELRAKIEEIKRDAKRMDEEYRQAEKGQKPQIDLSERNQEIVEQYMLIRMIEEMIVDRRGAQYDKSTPTTEKPSSPQDIKKRLQTAINHVKQGRCLPAIDDLNAILHDDRTHAEAYYYRGVAFAQLEKYQFATDDFGMAIQFRSEFVEAYWQRSGVYKHLRQYDAQIKDLAYVIHFSPLNAEAYRERGLALYSSKKYQAALSDLNEAVRLSPTDEEAYYFRAGVYMELGDYQRALADCQQSLKLGPESSFALDRMKKVQEKLSGN